MLFARFSPIGVIGAFPDCTWPCLYRGAGVVGIRSKAALFEMFG